MAEYDVPVEEGKDVPVLQSKGDACAGDWPRCSAPWEGTTKASAERMAEPDEEPRRRTEAAAAAAVAAAVRVRGRRRAVAGRRLVVAPAANDIAQVVMLARNLSNAITAK